MESVLAVLGNITTATTDIVTMALANPIMLIGTAAAIGGIAIGWFKSLTGQRRRGRK